MSEDALVSEEELRIAKNRSQGSIKAKAYYFSLKQRYSEQSERRNAKSRQLGRESKRASSAGRDKTTAKPLYRDFHSRSDKTQTLLVYIEFKTSFEIYPVNPNMEGLKDGLRRIGITGEESDEHLRSKILSLQGQYAIVNFITRGALNMSEIDEIDDFLEALGLSPNYSRGNHIARGAIRRRRTELGLSADRNREERETTERTASAGDSSTGTHGGDDATTSSESSRPTDPASSGRSGPSQRQENTEPEEHPASTQSSTSPEGEIPFGGRHWHQFLEGKTPEFKLIAEQWYQAFRRVELNNSRLNQEVRSRWTEQARAEHGQELMMAIIKRFDLEEDSIDPNMIDYPPISSENIDKYGVRGQRSHYTRQTVQAIINSYQHLRHTWLETPRPTSDSTRRSRIHKIREFQFKLDYFEHPNIVGDQYQG